MKLHAYHTPAGANRLRTGLEGFRACASSKDSHRLLELEVPGILADLTYSYLQGLWTGLVLFAREIHGI